MHRRPLLTAAALTDASDSAAMLSGEQISATTSRIRYVMSGKAIEINCINRKIMNFHSEKKTKAATQSSPRSLVAHIGTPLLIPALVFSTLFVTSVRATNVLDPDPENSTTLFGRALAVVGDVNGDRVPDLAVGTPFDDGEFNGQPGKGTPQNVGKVFVISGSTQAVITELIFY